MKRDVNIVIAAIAILIIGFIILTGVTTVAVFKDFIVGGDVYIREVLLNQFHNYSLSNNFHITTYLALYSLLSAAMVYILILLKRGLTAIKKGEIFTDKQTREFRKGGNGLIVYALAKYAISCLYGILEFNSPLVIIKAFMPFLIVYLLGRVALIISHMTEKGEYLKNENDLTI